ncbi:GntR family transcriptional regulator [Marinomonas pollencensis]|uniref:GntR family transcriptional regulator n=1 Tax=Marinomonas pollencensis TaxID=491954 RepID=A0A3E0DI86_9GAMM|nr:GntR family transcriptional regulator [Marinomonas pollencensis]REG81806.1 GntR family transcriptional regulator [Marinomonas pollencensis]
MQVNNQTNKTDVAYNQLERMIIFRELTPGSMVSEKQLAESLDLGRTPVREALQRLSYERMVEIHARRGIQIPLISVESQLKILEIRRDIEALCVKYAATRASIAEKQEMQMLALSLQECAEQKDDYRYADLLKQTHKLLVSAAQNEYLQLAMAPLQGLSRRFWFAFKNDSSDLKQGAALHSAVLKAVCHTDVEEAIAASHQLNDYLTDVAYRAIQSR